MRLLVLLVVFAGLFASEELTQELLDSSLRNNVAIFELLPEISLGIPREFEVSLDSATAVDVAGEYFDGFLVAPEGVAGHDFVGILMHLSWALVHFATR